MMHGCHGPQPPALIVFDFRGNPAVALTFSFGFGNSGPAGFLLCIQLLDHPFSPVRDRGHLDRLVLTHTTDFAQQLLATLELGDRGRRSVQVCIRLLAPLFVLPGAVGFLMLGGFRLVALDAGRLLADHGSAGLRGYN